MPTNNSNDSRLLWIKWITHQRSVNFLQEFVSLKLGQCVVIVHGRLVPIWLNAATAIQGLVAGRRKQLLGCAQPTHRVTQFDRGRKRLVVPIRPVPSLVAMNGSCQVTVTNRTALVPATISGTDFEMTAGRRGEIGGMGGKLAATERHANEMIAHAIFMAEWLLQQRKVALPETRSRGSSRIEYPAYSRLLDRFRGFRHTFRRKLYCWWPQWRTRHCQSKPH